MRRVNRMKRFAVAAICTAVLAGVSEYSAAGLAQAPDLPSAQTPAAPTAQAPASPDAPPPAAPVVATVAQGGTISGTVKASGVPLPGVAVTATNTLTGKKYATSTDVDGAFQMAVPRNGRYVVKTELTGFASVTQEILINASSENGGLPKQTAEFKMDLASRVTAQASTTSATTGTTTATTGTAVARVGRGTQALAVQGGQDSDLTDASAGQANTGAQLPSLATSTGDDTATESIAVSGQQGQTNGLAGFSEDDLRNRIQDMQRNGFANGDIATTLTGVMQTGTFGPGGPGGGGPGGGEGGGIMIMGGGGGPGGGFGGGGGRGGGGFNGFGGGFRGQNANAWHGSVGYTGSNSALNANSYSVTGRAIDKPQSDRNSLVASFTGTPYIPGWTKPNSKQFLFLSLSESRNTSPSTRQVIVPTLAQRYGDLTGLGTIYDPTTGLPYPITTVPGGAIGCASQVYAKNPAVTSCIPSSELASANSLAGQALLSYYPEPNVSSPLTQDNYQVNVPGTSDSSQVSVRYNRSFGATPVRAMRGAGGTRSQGGTTTRNRNAPPALRQSIAESFAYSHSASANSSFVPQLGGKSHTEGYSLSSAYTIGYGRINSTATLSWNRSRSIASNYFTNGGDNPAQDAGINVGNSDIYNKPFYFGVPSVNITGGYAGLSDATPSNSINQTISFSDFLSYSHKKHNMRFGFDFRRIHADSIGGTNVLGSFTFSGYATENPAQQQCVISATQTCTFAASGSAIADLLLGLPQQTKITAGLNKIYLRGNSWDWYAQDDWRARPNLTFNYGLRWEYFSPYSEKYNRLVNLNLTGSGSSLNITNVCATAAAGCASVGSPSSLVKPDKAMFSPRISIAWQPKSKWTKSTVVRSGYGINFNTGQYSRFATNLSFQQPFAITQTNTLSTPSSPTTCNTSNMTLTNGFNCSTQSTQSNFGVNPNYRLGMVQSYNLGIQRTLPQGVVLNIDYIGAYAGNLDIVRAPNRRATGVLNPDSGQFNYEDSLGYQRSNALTISARQRMHKGIALQAAYTYSHSIDNASSVGGSGSSIAQDDQNLGAEESNSSFDRRHALNGTFIIEPPFGPNRAFLNKGGIFAKILDGYSISGNFSFASGNFQTPTYSGTAQEIATGANSLRPDRVLGQSVKGAGSHLAWFNKAAFTAPAAGHYGNASRNSIELPGTVSFSGSLSRTVSFGGTRSFEARINANNALNTVQYSGVDTTLNSATFGQVISAAAMRSFTYNARFRF